MVGPCSCDLFPSQNNSSFSMLFSMQNHHNKSFDDEENMYPSSVDCTLSLGTPSTRLTDDDDSNRRGSHRVANFCGWDYLHQSKNSSPYGSQKSGRGGSNGGSNGNGNGGSDPLLARRCANCDTTSTPLWRNGPRGPKSLCNACGIRFKKEERRATAAGSNNGGATASGMMEPHHAYHYAQQPKMPCYSPAANEFRFIDENDRDFLSWRLNVQDRPTSLVHDFTRY